jgi:hypothetical protein
MVDEQRNAPKSRIGCFLIENLLAATSVIASVTLDKRSQH